MTSEELANQVAAYLAPKKAFDTGDVRDAIFLSLRNVRLVEESTEIALIDEDKRGFQLRKFLACKTIEGCTIRTRDYYASTIKRFMILIPKPFETVTPDDIRFYLALRAKTGAVSKVTQNSERRNLSSFFAWLTANDEIPKNPILTIKKIKHEKRIIKPFTEIEQEKLRVAAKDDLRLTAIIEVLFSTGVRVGELVGLNRDSIKGNEAVVFGKGQKERTVYLNARSCMALQLYLDSRTDGNPALFVAMFKPFKRLKISGVEIITRELGRMAGVPKTHPHRFRHTAATMALRRGMPIEQVRIMLGHEDIATTLLYAQVAEDEVRNAHRRLM